MILVELGDDFKGCIGNTFYNIEKERNLDWKLLNDICTYRFEHEKRLKRHQT